MSHKNTIAAKEMEQFAIKLQDWSATLPDNQQALLKHMFEVDRSKLVVGGFNLATGLAPRDLLPETLVFETAARKLDVRYFEVLCW